MAGRERGCGINACDFQDFYFEGDISDFKNQINQPKLPIKGFF